MIKPHPLQNFTLTAFAKQPAQDEFSLGCALAGAYVPGATTAYRKVAKDILGYMESQGLIERDDLGWYRLRYTGAGLAQKS
jgi:hypothetical protein